MKLLKFLPLFAVNAGKKEKNKNVDKIVTEDRSEYLYDYYAAQFLNQCSDQVPTLGGSFVTVNNGLSGELRLETYPEFVKCKHVVQANVNCRQIEVSYRSVAVEPASRCGSDRFFIDWPGVDPRSPEYERMKSPICGCFGDGCDMGLYDGTNGYYDPDYVYQYEIGHPESPFHFGEFDDVFTMNSNTFTFFFESNYAWNWDGHGHVIIDWECVDLATTTSTTTTTTTPTTTSTISTTAEST